MAETAATTTKASNSETAMSSKLQMDICLAVLRGAGLLLALTFGRQKVIAYLDLIRTGQPLASSGLAPLIRAMGLPFPGFLAICAVLNESVGALLIACGIFTRFFAAVGALGMSVAFYVSLRLGEEPLRAWLYLTIFASLAVVGPGRYSIDYVLRKRRSAG